MMSDLVFRKTDEVPKVVNVNEKRVIEVVERFLSQGLARCACDECALDILAMTLNAVPPKYIVNEVLMELHGNEHSPSNLELWRTVHECAQRSLTTQITGSASRLNASSTPAELKVKRRPTAFFFCSLKDSTR